MDILQEEYEKKRSVFELCSWINQKLLDFEIESDFNKSYFRRKGNNIKKVFEEAIPISYFGLYLQKPWHEISITCITGNQPYDAEIEIFNTGWKTTKTLKVEVTTTQDAESALRREVLSEDGIVSYTGSIRRENKNIIMEGEMINIEEESREVINFSFELLMKKIKHGYDKQTAILVYIDFYRKLSTRDRLDLIEMTRSFLRNNPQEIYGVYYCYSADYGVDGILNDFIYIT